MVPALAAERGGGVEQFLGRRGVGQGQAQRARARQRQVQILLVQFDAETGIEGALDHALAMHFEDARGGETAHQRLPHLGRVGAGSRGEQQRLADRLDRQCDDDLVGDLGGLPVADSPTSVMFLPISSNSGLTLAKACSGPPTMMVSDAALAPTSPPDTGASR